MKATLSRELVLDALLAAVWRRRPATEVLVHSDQGSQYSSDDFKRFCQAHSLVPSMSRHGNCWDNAVMESFFSSLKKERIRKRIYKTRDMARADVFDCLGAVQRKSEAGLQHLPPASMRPEDQPQALHQPRWFDSVANWLLKTSCI